MSKVQPQRPGAARRPGVAGPPSQASTQRGLSLEELRALPAFVEDGANVDLDPENASSGKMVEETATIASAKFVIQDWKRKDGTYPESAFPQVELQVFYKRDGGDADDKAYREGYRYGSVSMYAPAKDGNTVKVRPGVVKGDGYIPRPRRMEPAVLFLQSIKDAGGKNIIDKQNGSDGAGALAGLRVHVRSRKVEGQNEKAKPILLVDYIDGVKTANPVPVADAVPARAEAVQAAVAATAETDAVFSLAEEAFLDIRGQAAGNTISRAQIPTTLIRIDKWKAHEQRGLILKTLRDDAFILREGAPWKLDGSNVSLG